MRRTSFLLGLGLGVTLASAAAAQVTPILPDIATQMRLDALSAQLQIQQQRNVATENEFQALDARVRTDQALRDLQAESEQPRLRVPPDPVYGAANPNYDPARLASIPDDRLKASNARVRAAAANTR